MSILTKTLVVLVTILSIVLVALVVPLVATQDDLTTKLSDKGNELAAVQDQLKILQSEITFAQNNESATIASLRTELNTRTAALDAEKAAKVKAENDAKVAQHQLNEFKASYTSLAGSMAEHVETNKLLNTQLAKSQETIQTQGTRIIEQADKIDEVTSERDTLDRMVKNLREQMVALREDLTKTEEVLAQLPPEVLQADEGPKDIRPDDDIVGQIVEVQSLGDGLVLVQVNVGESDKVKEGMKFLVHQGDEFKGTLVISRVEPRLSVGKMELVQADPLKGDSVYAGPN